MRNTILIELRGKRSRAEVAKELGITTQGFGMIERRKRIPRPDLMKRIADYYNKTVDELFFGTLGHEMYQDSIPCCPNPAKPDPAA
ncbi:hypothetical protein SCACP_38920 [Sporomusa carbonis]|uniref:helix-turn-helix transcriptional regulator n=1 Tax=Sporomusa carbonis TaxID=3076075 RepID=UPI003A619C4F